MSLGFLPLRRRFERLGAILSAIAVLMSMMVILAPAALAHHPEVTAFQMCVEKDLVIHYDAISWKTDGTSGSGNDDIQIEVRANGAGNWSQVGTGAFTSSNSYRFSGDFDASPYLGQSIEVQARSVDPWDNDVPGGQTWVTDPIFVDLKCDQTRDSECEQSQLEGFSALNSSSENEGNDPCEPPPDCEQNQAEPSFTLNSSSSGPEGNDPCEPPPDCEQNQAEPSFTLNSSSSGQEGNDPCEPPPDCEQNQAEPSFAPNSSSSEHPEHDRCEAKVVVTSGDCDPLDGALGVVDVTIEPADGAVVTVYSDEEMQNEVASFEGVGGSSALAPGTYYWQAEAAQGFKLKGDDDGHFKIDPCEPPVSDCEDPYQDFSTQSGSSSEHHEHDRCDVVVVVTSGDCDPLDGALGVVEATIEPAEGADVTVYSDEEMEDEVAFFDGVGGSASLAPGTYYWEAEAEKGFKLKGDDEGEFTIAPCNVGFLVANAVCHTAGGPVGSVTVSIDPESGGTVAVTGPGGPHNFDGSGSKNLPPGTYGWVATPNEGFEFPEGQATSGGFTIAPCGASVLVAQGICGPPATTNGLVSVAIDPGSAATVSFFNSSNTLVTSLNVSGSFTLNEGTYTWNAVPAPGFQLIGATSGALQVVVCDVVEAVEILPFTGIDSEKLLGGAIVLLVVGISLIHIARRGQEG